MFEKLTPRERKLVFATMGLVPAAVIFIAVFWFIGKYGENNQQSMALMTNIKTEKERMHAALKANRRRQLYNSVSMPPGINSSSNEYQVWLKKQLSELDMEIRSIQPRDAGTLKFEQTPIGKRKSYTITTKGDLKQLTEFLAKFYSVDLLHRINSLKITPQNEVVGNNKKVRSGMLTLSMTIEVLALDEADERTEFTEKFRELARTTEDYQQKIIRRNVFGPANNIPVLSARPSSFYYTDKDIKISISAKDADDGDLIGFEIVDVGNVEGDMELLQRKPEDRLAQLVIPAQKAGEYNLKIRCFDNGFPAKESFVDVKFNTRDKPAPKPIVKKDPPPPPPPYKHAKQTKIGSMVRGIDGIWEVWIKVRTTGESHRLKVGEVFEVDERKWTVKSITSDQIVINVDDKLMTYFEGDVLASPRAEKDDPNAPPAEKVGADLPPVPKKVAEVANTK